MASKQKRNPAGTIVFYSLYLLLIVAFCIGMFYISGALTDWLETFEDSQPKYKCQEVFDTLFADPDWETIYDLAKVEDTVYEGKTQFVTYMENRLIGKTISYSETSAGLSGNKKYIVKADEEKIATFTLVSSETEEGGDTLLPTGQSELADKVNSESNIVSWELGEVEVFFTRKESVTVTAVGSHRVTVNGVPLGEDAVIHTLSTAAEDYLPEGIHGLQSATYYLDGLLLAPEVTVLNESGESQTLYYDAEQNRYSETLPSFEITGEEKTLLLSTAETYCKFMIGAAKTADLKNYFDTASDIYNTIRKSDTWMQSYKGYTFVNESVSNLYRYSDDLFSAKVTLSLNVTRTNGTVKEYGLDSYFFFTRQENGNYLATEMTNVDLSATEETVRITYFAGDTVLESSLVSAAAKQMTPPSVTAAEGQVFTGWATETVDENGNITFTVLFLPTEDGIIYLPEDYTAEPLTLYAVFETKGA